MSNLPESQASQLIEFIDASPTPFHAVQTVVNRLKTAQFVELQESEIWEMQPGGRYYVIREDATIAAWIMGRVAPALAGLQIIGWHTDSPNLRIKPNPEVTTCGYHQVGVEMYGGVLLTTWTDRDLSLAGRVLVQQDQTIRKHFVKVERPLLRIPQLAIHLNREVNKTGLLLNAQKHLPPILALETENSKHPLKTVLAETLEVEPDQILNYDLSLYDLQKSGLLGVHQEFVIAPRLDNLFSGFCALEALVHLSESSAVPEATCMIVGFDNEEIGSQTTQGAKSSFLRHAIQRINSAHPESHAQAYERSIAQSMFISADMAHAVHPNYQDQHEPQHHPKMNQGPVIKVNVQGAYATSGFSSAHFESICRQRDIPLQKFVNRTDLACGSTIGPVVASGLGLPVVDVGAAMLSMHSIREMCGSQDADYMTQAFCGFFEQ